MSLFECYQRVIADSKYARIQLTLIFAFILLPFALFTSLHQKLCHPGVVWLGLILPFTYMAFYCGMKGLWLALFTSMLATGFNLVYPGSTVDWLLFGVAIVTIVINSLNGEIYLRKSTTLQKQCERLFEEAITDSLTGLFNRRFFLLRLEEEVTRSHRQNSSLSLLMLDMNNFNKINDRYGLSVGDKILKDVANILKRTVRTVDIVARYGGEEFAVLLVDAFPELALEAAERIQQAVEEYAMLNEQQGTAGLKVSMGLASYPENSRNAKELIQHSVQALAKVKRSAIKEQEEQLRQSEKYAVIGQLSAGLAHEIRNPLTSVKGFIQLLERKYQESIDQEYIDINISELDRVGKLVNEFLILAKPTGPNLEPVNIQEVIAKIVLFMESEAMLKDVQIEQNLPAKLPEMLLDAGQFKQVLINLIRNAIEAMPQGGKILLRAEYVHTEGQLAIIVDDTGTGIPQDKVEQIFEPFVTTKAEGTGLGLAVSSRIIDGHGGKLLVENKPEHGARFVIYLPVKS